MRADVIDSDAQQVPMATPIQQIYSLFVGVHVC